MQRIIVPYSILCWLHVRCYTVVLHCPFDSSLLFHLVNDSVWKYSEIRTNMSLLQLVYCSIQQTEYLYKTKNSRANEDVQVYRENETVITQITMRLISEKSLV